MNLHTHCGHTGPGKAPGRSSYGMHDSEKLFGALGLENGQAFLDLGCGPGDYALRAARLVGAQGRVLAVDRSAELVRHVSTRAAAEGLTHLETLAADITGELPLRTGSFDLCLLCTVLHSLGHEKRGRVLREAHRLLAPAGRLAVVEIKKEPMDFGPPLEQRLSEDELERLAADTGFRRILSTGLGPTHLGIFAAQ